MAANTDEEKKKVQQYMAARLKPLIEAGKLFKNFIEKDKFYKNYSLKQV